jgi:hypothetical protein
VTCLHSVGQRWAAGDWIIPICGVLQHGIVQAGATPATSATTSSAGGVTDCALGIEQCRTADGWIVPTLGISQHGIVPPGATVAISATTSANTNALVRMGRCSAGFRHCAEVPMTRWISKMHVPRRTTGREHGSAQPL